MKRPDGGAQWVLRYTIHGRRREMGLGTVTLVPLKEARETADRHRVSVRAGKDPSREKERQRREAGRNLHLLDDIARDAFKVRKTKLKGDANAYRWFSPIELHVLPKLGKVPVADLDQKDIRDALAPIWHAKGETAKKALIRLGLILKHAAALGLDVDLQVTEKARALLGKTRQQRAHIPAMPWKEVPAFYASLSDGTLTHLALRLLILTGMRSAPVRMIRDEQIEGDVWTVPAALMKGRKGATADFRVPLSTAALSVIAEARRHERRGYLFANPTRGVISDMTTSMYMKRKGLDYRPHGFRSSLRDWIEEATSTLYEVAETVLGMSSVARWSGLTGERTTSTSDGRSWRASAARQHSHSRLHSGVCSAGNV